MEPEAALFLKKVAKSVFIGFVWLAITSVIAVKGDNAFFEKNISLGNVVFTTTVIVRKAFPQGTHSSAFLRASVPPW